MWSRRLSASQPLLRQYNTRAYNRAAQNTFFSLFSATGDFMVKTVRWHRILVAAIFVLLTSDAVVAEDAPTEHSSETEPALPGIFGGNWWDMATRYATYRDFKIEVESGSTECFYEKLVNGTNLNFNFEVLRGGDRAIDVRLRNDDADEVIRHFVWSTEGTIDVEVNKTGTYSFCFDNAFGNWNSKFVYLHISTFIPFLWNNMFKEISELDASTQNFTNAVDNVDRSIVRIFDYLSVSKHHAIADWYILSKNNSFVNTWAFCQAAVTIFASLCQVYMIRRLFNQPGSAAKPRA